MGKKPPAAEPPPLLFVSPVRDLLPLSSPEQVIRLLTKTGRKYWLRGSGDAEIRFATGPDSYSSLSLMRRPQFGWHLMYAEHQGNAHVRNSTYIAIRHRNFARMVSLWVGGDFFRFPQAALFSSRLAMRVIRDFCLTGKRSPLVLWGKHPLPTKDGEIYGRPY
jgi:hypothetical protein